VMNSINVQEDRSSLGPIISRLKTSLLDEGALKRDGKPALKIEELSKSYLRDQLEVLDLGLFDSSVLKAFEITRNLVE